MGEPIYLQKGKDKLTVYGRHEAANYVAKGWQLGDASVGLSLPTATFDATDRARELAEDYAIDLALVAGTGQNGRIIQADVQKYIDNHTSAN